MLEIVYLWLLASAVCGIWPFFLLLLGVERPGVFVAIAPALIPVMAVMSIPLLVMGTLNFIGGSALPTRRQTIRI